MLTQKETEKAITTTTVTVTKQLTLTLTGAEADMLRKLLYYTNIQSQIYSCLSTQEEKDFYTKLLDTLRDTVTFTETSIKSIT